eukprot:695960-Prorocentrum_minimum.AAC.1
MAEERAGDLVSLNKEVVCRCIRARPLCLQIEVDPPRLKTGSTVGFWALYLLGVALGRCLFASSERLAAEVRAEKKFPEGGGKMKLHSRVAARVRCWLAQVRTIDHRAVGNAMTV